MPYDGTKLNLDGSPHACSTKPAGGRFTSSKPALEQATAIYEIAESMLAQFKQRRGTPGTDGFDSEVIKPIEIGIEQEIVFIESIFRTLSGNFKA
jgi:hypothetical protein